jgi:hypothetical protein
MPSVESSPSRRVELSPNHTSAPRELVLFALALSVLSGALIAAHRPIVVVLGIDLVVILLLIGLYVSARNQRVFVDEQGGGWVNRLGRSRRFPPNTTMRCQRTLGGGSQLFIMFLASDGRRLFSSPARVWDMTRLNELCVSAGIEIETPAAGV